MKNSLTFILCLSFFTATAQVDFGALPFPSKIPNEFVLFGETVRKDKIPRELMNIKDQGRCGSCGAYAVASMIEHHMAVFGDQEGRYVPGTKLSTYVLFVGTAWRSGMYSEDICNTGTPLSGILRGVQRNHVRLIDEMYYPDSLLNKRSNQPKKYDLLSKEQLLNEAPMYDATGQQELNGYRMNSSGPIKVKTTDEIIDILKSGRTVVVEIWAGPTYDPISKEAMESVDWFEWDGGVDRSDFRIFPGAWCKYGAKSSECIGGWHAIELVGFDGTHPTPYWILKNSAGKHYGISPYPNFTDRGFMRLAMETAMFRVAFSFGFPGTK